LTATGGRKLAASVVGIVGLSGIAITPVRHRALSTPAKSIIGATAAIVARPPGA
jgi:hypothetical protein